MADGVRPIFEVWMRKEDLRGMPHIILYALSIAYGAAVRLRYFLYKYGILKARRLPCKVISVGNITVGGSGKTPMAIHIAGILKAKGIRVVILSRGYRGAAGKGISAVSDGKNIMLGPVDAGDEPYLMARRLPGVPVVIGADRVKAGIYAIDKFNPHCIILDDGFQHIRLARDLDILLVDGQAGFGNGYLLPRGILREPMAGLKRATAAFVKGGNLNASDSEALKKPEIPVLKFNYRPAKLRDLRGGFASDTALLNGKKVLAVAGIAGPESFFKTLAGLNAAIVKTIVYPDHHDYTRTDVEKIKAEASRSGADIIVTTEKDGVKLDRFASGGLPIYALGIEVIIEDTGAFNKLLAPFIKCDG